MCAEALPWRCHRSLVGDALLIRGFDVEDIINDRTSRPHKMTAWGKVVDDVITYPETTVRSNGPGSGRVTRWEYPSLMVRIKFELDALPAADGLALRL